ncbi:MAG: thiamine phosphate synthase [Corynebacterium casei]|uniref:Thiamine-phosphate synthase n=1 Tax=Corynebacterium casei LMG S-19264 TaxID=1285583 RepID=A0ABM5PNS9_9CORY|nr:thiamine phosphate synthase [Corynebacterium casei]AHI19593.1 thiamine-phosphate pyrophosphorylase [Corynebacterium casei LMG S-19264]MDN5741065.1 thiamine phosphate synthase [Corynebacterium casei]MDN5826360.1 thiamine phosphate synthase [Corynebacterium casei]MDN5884644.1 thiamine phosphate synthase [Corynebacterium casei]MDN6274334.1 thiamine phosphate synthase [Corynebacterium casei]
MKTRAQLDLRCYVVTGNGSQDDIVATAAQAAAGGAGVIQVRSKPIGAGQLLKLAEKVSLAVAEANPATKILIDDRVDIAAILMRRGLPVHGVHVGQSDILVTDVRELLGPDAIIGLTTGTAELIQQANEYADIIDYVGAGPFRPTPTKDSGRAPIGLEGYPQLVELSKLPIVAIGDVQPADVAALASTGIAGVAMVRAFIEAPSATELAQQIIADFSAGLQMSGATS